MAYTVNKEGEITISGFDQGIATSPHKGIANIQGGNISTESGEVLASFARVQQGQVNNSGAGTLAPLDSTHLTPSFTGGLAGGIWINISASSISGLSTGNYYILSSASGFTSVQLSSTYLGSAVSGLGNSGSATFTLIRNMGQPLASTTERYSTGTAFRFRYYILDVNGLVWINDSNVTTPGVTWFLPDTTQLSNVSGITVLNGWVMVFTANTIQCKPTVLLGGSAPGWVAFTNVQPLDLATTPNIHFPFVANSGTLYYTDGSFIGSIFPNTNISNQAIINIQSYASYTAITTTGTITTLIGGSLPTTGDTSALLRVPAVFFCSSANSGAIPTALSGLAGGTATRSPIVYIAYSPLVNTFAVYSASSGGSALDISDGVGTQYFNTFYPTGSAAISSGLIAWSPERITLPYSEVAQCLNQVGSNIIIGTASNSLFSWAESVTNLVPDTVTALPEANTSSLLNVNNMIYAFTGNRGNIYVGNGSTASIALKVPDYCAGIAGTASTYIEPYFTWGGTMYLRGRVYFSILDQTSTKAGNCGGVWSFIPTNNLYVGQDAGMSLRLENQNSYGTYNGYAAVLLRSEIQTVRSPQYWSGWQSDANSSIKYGIDFTDTSPSTPVLIETDLIPTGTLLNKQTLRQVELKFAAPLFAGSESASVKYRLNGTDSFATVGTTQSETTPTDTASGGTQPISVYIPVDFEKSQWLQLQITLNPNGAIGSSSFCRLREIIIR